MSIKKNLIYNITYQILIIILPLITTPYISRVIGAEGVGVQSYTYSIVSYFVLFIMLGINNYGNRTIAMARNNKETLNRAFVSIYIIQISMAIIMSILYVLYIIFMVKDNKVLYYIQSIYLIAAMLDINWFFFGMEEFKLTVVRNTVIKIVLIVAIFIFVKDKNDIYVYAFILAISTLISQIVLWRYLGKYIKFTKVIVGDVIVNIKPILILFIPVISISIYKIMDKIMLGSMSNLTQVGFFESAEKIINIPIGIIIALGTVMLPRMSNLYASGNESVGKKYIELSMEFIMFMAYGAMFGIVGVSNILIPIFLGKQFTECIGVVDVLSITILFISWANVIRTQYLIPKKKDKVYIKSTILGAIMNLIFNILLIRNLGAVGAAIGTIFAEATVAIYQSLSIKNELDIKRYFGKTIYYIVPGIIMCTFNKIIGIAMKESIITGIVQILIGGVIYCSISFIYLISRGNDIVIKNIHVIITKFNKLYRGNKK